MSWRPADSRIAFAQNRLDNFITAQESLLGRLCESLSHARTADQRTASNTMVEMTKVTLAEARQIRNDLTAGLQELEK